MQRIFKVRCTSMGGGKGAALGGVAGAALGLLAGPALIVPAAVGALVGGLSAKLRDSSFSDRRLETLGEGLTPGSSAIIAVIEHTWVDQVRRELQEAGADLLTAELKADIASQLEAGHDVAYSTLAAREGFAAQRLAVGEDEVQGVDFAVTEEGVYSSRYVATEEGFAVERLIATDEGVIASAGVAGMGDSAEEAGSE